MLAKFIRLFHTLPSGERLARHLNSNKSTVLPNQALPEGVPSGQADGMSSLQNSWRAKYLFLIIMLVA
jgi:hypothetical protein